MSKPTLSIPLKIISVDDSPIVTKRMLSLFDDMPAVEFLGNARNALTALALISKQVPDVVILDIHLDEKMPHANGIDLLIILRERYPQMKVIMFTNLTLPQYRDRCLEFGADYFLDKSNDFYRIPEALEEIARAADGKNETDSRQP
jgi:DNA-binding NarL/FixJ family response regulator